VPTEGDVRDLGDVGPQVGADGAPGQGLERRDADEVQRRGRRDDGDLGAEPPERADELRSLVRRDPAADPEDDSQEGSWTSSIGSVRSRPSLISRSAIDSGFSWT